MTLVECQLPANGSGETGGGGGAAGTSWISRTGREFNFNLQFNCRSLQQAEQRGFGGHLNKTENEFGMYWTVGLCGLECSKPLFWLVSEYG